MSYLEKKGFVLVVSSSNREPQQRDILQQLEFDKCNMKASLFLLKITMCHSVPKHLSAYLFLSHLDITSLHQGDRPCLKLV